MTADAARWADLALCAEVDSDLFFPEENSQAPDARAVCRGCEARPQCLEYALDHFTEGVWGGFTERSREGMNHRRRLGESAADIIAADDAEFYAQAERSAELAQTARDRKNALARAKFAAARNALAELEEAS
jgi:hypothetical protein